MSQALVEHTQDETSLQADAGGLESYEHQAAGESQVEANEHLAASSDAAPFGADSGLADEGSGEFSPFHASDFDDPLDAVEAYRQRVQSVDLTKLREDAATLTAEPGPDDEPPITGAIDQGQPETVTQPAEGDRAPQFRLRPRTPLGERAFALMKEDPYLTEEAAFAKARAELEPADQRTEEQSAPDDAGTIESMESVRARLRQLRRDRIEATREYDAERLAEIDEEVLDLEERLPVLEQAEAARRHAEAEADQNWLRIAQETASAVAAQYPAASEPTSRFARRMTEIDEAWEAAGDRRFDDPQKAMVIAGIVAKEFGVAAAGANGSGRRLPTPQGKHSTEATSANPGTAPGRRLAPPLGPVSGAARTTAPASEESLVKRAVAAVNGDPDEFLRIKEQLLSGQAA